MDDLVQWLGVQLDEDERIARSTGGVSYVDWAELGWIHGAVPEGEWRGPGSDGRYVGAVQLAEDRAHIAAHDPARVLREIDAKRQILAECAYWDDKLWQEAAAPPKYPQPGLGERLEAAMPILRLLALPYADRPGYRDEWRP